jgi:predicted TIM-barrel fold metal-dependent hydrolase
MNQLLSLANPAMRDVGPTMDRTIRQANGKVPEGTVIVAADTHWEVCEDIFYEAFPDHLKDKAPRVWFDKYWHMGFPGAAEAVKADAEGERVAVRCLAGGITDLDIRRAHLGMEGISKEIVYPQSLLFFVGHKDRDIQERIWRTYNEYIAGVGGDAPDSFYGVGVFSNWWDPAAAERAMRQIVDLKLKTFMIPVFPKDIDGRDISYGDVAMDRFWAVAAEAGLPVSFHVTEGFMPGSRGALGIAIANAPNHFRRPFSQLIFGGVLDRHPELKVVFAEGGISWVLTALQDAEMVCDSFGDLVDPIKLRPSDYWRNNCYATFQNDLLGLRNLAYLGAENVMWSNDYPHPEGAFGYSADAIQDVLDHTTEEQARRILGETAIELYRLD